MFGSQMMAVIWKSIYFLVILVLFTSIGQTGASEGPSTFEIRVFVVEGNTLYPAKSVQEVLQPYKGTGKTSSDVEAARSALEKMYHNNGYPAVFVNIPEQTIEDGTIRLEVVESIIGSTRVTGNRWFTREKILRGLPSLAPGKVLYVPDVQTDLERLNRSSDLKVSPSLAPGKDAGTTDVTLKVEDQFPFHGSIELNNRSTHDTTDLRLNAMLRYDNLWQKDHSVSIQYQTSPKDTSEVQLYALSYALPAPWLVDHQIALFGIRSDSKTLSSAEGLLVTGKGNIFGARYIIPLDPYQKYAHNLTIGVDYKDIEENTGLDGTSSAAMEKKPVKYLPLSFAYSASLPDSLGMTRFSGGLNMAFRGLITDSEEFQNKRANSRGNYLYFTAGVERDLKLPAELNLFMKIDGQISDQPLISSEQYSAGGMLNVRGYKEGEAAGDDAWHGTIELSAADIGNILGLKDRFSMTPFLFYDLAWLSVKDPLPGENEIVRLRSAGAGFRGSLYKNTFYEAVAAFPLTGTAKTERNEARWHFKVGYQF